MIAATLFGLFEPVRSSSKIGNQEFVARAVAFFSDVVRALPKSAEEEMEREIFPQLENRRLVIRHLTRERSRLLATECKIRDNYTCQVCSVCFKRRYGDIEREWARRITYSSVAIATKRQHKASRSCYCVCQLPSYAA